MYLLSDNGSHTFVTSSARPGPAHRRGNGSAAAPPPPPPPPRTTGAFGEGLRECGAAVPEKPRLGMMRGRGEAVEAPGRESRRPNGRRGRISSSAGMVGSTTLEGVIGLVMLVTALVMPVTGLIQKITITDSLGAAAQEAAEAAAMLEAAPAGEDALQTVLCDAVKRSLGRSAETRCEDEWTLEFQAFASPSALAADPPTPRTEGSAGGEDGDIVRVLVYLKKTPLWHRLLPDPAYAAPGDGRGPPIAVGFARNARASADTA